MRTISAKCTRFMYIVVLGMFCAGVSLVQSHAKDTDIYAVNTKQNCYVLLDSSGSMKFGVYEQSVDYAAMFDYLFTLNDNPVGDYDDYIYDTINNSAYFFTHKQDRRKIYLWRGAIGVTIANVNGNQVAFTGDAADPDYLWFMANLVDTHTVIDADGNLAPDGSGLTQRVTVDAATGNVLLDGHALPLGLDIKLHDYKTLYNGSVVDNGFGGLLNAPGYYFSGYEGVTPGALDVAESGDTNIYFFVTGNWVNMQAMYNLHYTTSTGLPSGASNGDMAWVYERFPLVPDSWLAIPHALDYPSGSGNYAKNLTETTTLQTISHPGALKIQVHFSMFDVEGDGGGSTFGRDFVRIRDKSGVSIVQYDNDKRPTNSTFPAAGFWSPVIVGDTAVISLKSNNNNIVRPGYTIDQIRVVYEAGESYLMQSRMDVAKDALSYTVETFQSKLNWGLASFADAAHGGYGNGAYVRRLISPTESDAVQVADMKSKISAITAFHGTPLMEALQDVWNVGYYQRRATLSDVLCRKNYIISLTDGFPSVDTDNARISGVTFADFDGDGWTSDPYQPPTSPNFYDDVANWLYTHSWVDKSAVSDPANSYVNVVTHQISFGAFHPLLENAASEAGGHYITTYNKEQLVAAFYSLGLMMSDSISFTAPVVSVDAANKIQSGEDLYMGLFLPESSSYWPGNVKKFKLGDGSPDRPKLWMIYDKANNEAVDSNGTFIDDTAAFWGDDLDGNDTNTQGAPEIKEDGVGEVLLEDVQGYFAAATYWNRAIYTWKGGVLTKFDRDHITASDLGVADDATRDKLINFTHGYSYDADASGNPLAVRDWVLGAVIHSRPVVVDYYDTTSVSLPLQKRFVVVGSNDGMLHVFDDVNGKEVLAFIPPDIMPNLKEVQAHWLYETVDGLVTLYRRAKNPKYLIFGERRGGSTYWCLDVSHPDPLHWTVAWEYQNAEIAQSWSEVKIASIPVGIVRATGERQYKDVAIFAGGYDSEEDSYPEPFNDLNNNGTPYASSGSIDTNEWVAANSAHDINGNGVYDIFNPDMNAQGRGFFVVDIDNPANVVKIGTTQVLPFSATYGAMLLNTGVAQTYPGMKYCFPASPSLALGTEQFNYLLGGIMTRGVGVNVLLAAYNIDIYGNLYKLTYDFEVTNSGTETTPDWDVDTASWGIRKVFSANPGSLNTSGVLRQGDSTDLGRKAFYTPAISWGGSGYYFDLGNYYYSGITFDGLDALSTLFFGTGDREHPQYTLVRNRFYSVYDDSTVTAKTFDQLTSYTVTTAPYTEDDLLNLTCDELGTDSTINDCYLGSLGGLCSDVMSIADKSTAMKKYLKTLLTDDATYDMPLELEDGVHENDAKGWYIILPDQGKTGGCNHVSYAGIPNDTMANSRDNHLGEQVLSQPTLYYGTVYFTTYQPSLSDPCNPQGNGFSYAINYLTGAASLNHNASNDLVDAKRKDITDRYVKYTHVSGIPSGFAILTRKGHAAAMASMGGSIIGGGEKKTPTDPPYEIPSPGLGLELYYWRDSNSMQ